MSAPRDAFDACVRVAASEADGLMKSLIGSALGQLFRRAGSNRTETERNTRQDAVRLLDQHEEMLRRRFGELLLAEFSTGEVSVVNRAEPLAVISLDNLELMDDHQVQERVEIARLQQSIQQTAETELEELNRLICGAQGLDRVSAERNPMRPEVYARALLAALTQTGESAQVRLVWIQSMGGALGAGLAVNYRSLSRMLRDAGVVSFGYQVVKASDGVSGGSAQTGWQSPHRGAFGRPPRSVRVRSAGEAVRLERVPHRRRLVALVADLDQREGQPVHVHRRQWQSAVHEPAFPDPAV